MISCDHKNLTALFTFIFKENGKICHNAFIYEVRALGKRKYTGEELQSVSAGGQACLSSCYSPWKWQYVESPSRQTAESSKNIILKI